MSGRIRKFLSGLFGEKTQTPLPPQPLYSQGWKLLEVERMVVDEQLSWPTARPRQDIMDDLDEVSHHLEFARPQAHTPFVSPHLSVVLYMRPDTIGVRLYPTYAQNMSRAPDPIEMKKFFPGDETGAKDNARHLIDELARRGVTFKFEDKALEGLQLLAHAWNTEAHMKSVPLADIEKTVRSKPQP